MATNTGQLGDATTSGTVASTDKLTSTTAAGALQTTAVGLLTTYLAALWADLAGGFVSFGFTTKATAAGTTTLTVTSKNIQEFTGATTQTIVMPVASTLATGRIFRIINNSTGNITVNSSGSNLIILVKAGASCDVTCVLASGTTAASWSYTDFQLVSKKDTSGSYVGLTLFAINSVNVAGTFTSFITNAATAARTWTMPDRSGTVSLVDDFAMGEVAYFNTTGTSLSIPGTSNGSTNMMKLAVATGVGSFGGTVDAGGTTSRLRNNSSVSQMYHCAATFSGTPATANDIFVIGFAVNDAVDPDCKVLSTFAGTQTIAMHCMLTLAAGEYAEIYIGNTTATRNITIKTFNLFMMSVPALSR